MEKMIPFASPPSLAVVCAAVREHFAHVVPDDDGDLVVQWSDGHMTILVEQCTLDELNRFRVFAKPKTFTLEGLHMPAGVVRIGIGW